MLAGTDDMNIFGACVIVWVKEGFGTMQTVKKNNHHNVVLSAVSFHWKRTCLGSKIAQNLRNWSAHEKTMLLPVEEEKKGDRVTVKVDKSFSMPVLFLFCSRCRGSSRRPGPEEEERRGRRGWGRRRRRWRLVPLADRRPCVILSCFCPSQSTSGPDLRQTTTSAALQQQTGNNSRDSISSNRNSDVRY